MLEPRGVRGESVCKNASRPMRGAVKDFIRVSGGRARLGCFFSSSVFDCLKESELQRIDAILEETLPGWS